MTHSRGSIITRLGSTTPIISNKVNKNFQIMDKDLRFKTRHLLQLVEWVKNALDLQVGDHHHHLEEKL